jgi:primosomal protein N' (replication factor Y)
MKRDYEAFYREEIKVRQEYVYPPFCRLCRFTFFHRDKAISREAAAIFAAQAEKQKNIRVLGPAEPSVGKVKNLFLYEVLIKMPRSSEVQHFKSIFRQIIDKLQAEAPFKQVRVVPDIDPY